VLSRYQPAPRRVKPTFLTAQRQKPCATQALQLRRGRDGGGRPVSPPKSCPQRPTVLSLLPGPSAGHLFRACCWVLRPDNGETDGAADDAVAPERFNDTSHARSSTRTSGQAKTAGRRPKQQTECADPAQALVSEHRQAVVEACQTERYQRGSRGLSRVLLREPAPERGVDSHLSSSHRRAARQMSEPREMTLETAKCGWN
jgi:hypothetical protein